MTNGIFVGMSTESSSSLRWYPTVNRLNRPIGDQRNADGVVQDAWQEMLLWSRVLLTVDEIVERFNGQLPIIAFANRGYHDIDKIGGLSLAEGQILQIYGYRKETRVYAVDSSGRRLSLPFNCQLDIVDQSTNSPITWSDVTNLLSHGNDCRDPNHPIPVRIVNRNQAALLLPPDVTDLTLTHLETHSVLLANCIENGWLVHDVVLVIPDELKSQFRIAMNLKESSAVDLWTDYCAMFERVSRHINESFVTDYRGAIYSDWTDKRRPATQPIDHVTPQPMNDVTISVPSSYSYMSIADLNLTNSMTSLLQSGSRMMRLGSEPVLMTSLNALSLKQANTRQQRSHRQKKVTPHIQNTELESLKLNAIVRTTSTAIAVPSGESIRTRSSRSVNQLEVPTREDRRRQRSNQMVKISTTWKKEEEFARPSRPAISRLTSIGDVTSVAHPVQCPSDIRHRSEPCLIDRTFARQDDHSHTRSVIAISSSDHEVIASMYPNRIAERRLRDVIRSKAASRIARLTHRKYVVCESCTMGSFDEGYMTKDSTIPEVSKTSHVSLSSSGMVNFV